jgi:hypothetical protein
MRTKSKTRIGANMALAALLIAGALGTAQADVTKISLLGDGTIG